MRRFGTVLLGILLALLLSGGALAAETAVNSYSARCVVDEHGRGKMTVTVDMTLPNTATELDFPIGDGSSGIVAGQDSSRVKTDEGYVLRIEAESGFSGSRAFTYSYSMGQVVTDAGEGQLLELELISPGWQWPIDTASFTVVMPSAFTQTPAYVGGYHGDLVEDYWTLSQAGTEFSGVSDEALLDHDNLRVTLELPAGYVTPGAGLSSTVLLVITGVLAAICLFYWYFRLYAPRPRSESRRIPPEGAGAGDMPMLCTCDRPSLPLQVMFWASLGYLEIYLNKKDRIVLRCLKPMGPERRKEERTAFRMIFARDGRCDGEGVRFRRVAGRYEAAAERYWKRRLFSRTGGSPMALHLLAALAAGTAMLGPVSGIVTDGTWYTVMLILAALAGILAAFVVQEGVLGALRRRYGWTVAGALAVLAALAVSWIWGGFPVMLPAMALQVLAALATLRGGRRNRRGREALGQALGYCRYLSRITTPQLVSRLRDDHQFFYKALPYAEAMGVGGVFARRLGDIEIEPCQWLTRERPMPRAGEEFYTILRGVLRRMEKR